MWPGIGLAAICAVCCLILWGLVNIGDQDLTITVYPELLLVPVFAHWIYVNWKMHSVLKHVTRGTYPVHPERAALLSACTGPVGFWFSGALLGFMAQALAAVFATDANLKVLGLFLLVGSIFFCYSAATALNVFYAFKVFGNLNKLGVKLGLKSNAMQPWLVTGTLVFPGLWYFIQTNTASADYSTFLLFVVWQSVLMALTSLSISSTFRILTPGLLAGIDCSKPLPGLDTSANASGTPAGTGDRPASSLAKASPGEGPLSQQDVPDSIVLAPKPEGVAIRKEEAP